ncbi:GerAB/ArcD/ProY family transporter [Paenibacillus hexagrammi]|uniref:Spore germination protein n=1 Tax=Paenibacillus hexagrammi TaxID=2908839 RepID=A0ABY3SPI3_9BACL|nr:endospore germination permease [Paenibacillus sp. YPD9-1]UJF35035.1 spore germination protein [Paenibacillus sp. YPD9-1]
MKSFEYGDREIGPIEMGVTVSSMIIGVGVLSLPRNIAKLTLSSDGWISILIGGIISMSVAWVLAKFASMFYKQGFFAFASAAATKPVAYVVTTSLALYFLMYSGYEVRSIANIAKQYLFERTPVEVIALTFLLVVVYAVSGSRVGLIRLNILFLPFVIFISLIVLVFSASIFHFKDLKPYLISDWTQIAQGIKGSTFSLLGFEVVLFYVTLMNNPKKAPLATVIGVAIPTLLYIAIYLISVGVFTHFALFQVTYPTIELAKEMQIPGEFFERFESIFFTIWIMAVFTTTFMAYDCAIYAIRSMNDKLKHITWVFILSPVIYLSCMLPRNIQEFQKIGTLISYTGIIVAIILPISIYIVAKIRGVQSDAS